MVNSEGFIKRLGIILDYYHLSAAAFADKISVQRSSISHLMSGRNKPSLEFVLKVVRTFPEVNLYWLINGKGVFPSDEKEVIPPLPDKSTKEKKEFSNTFPTQKKIERIIIFYLDGSFKTYEGVSSE